MSSPPSGSSRFDVRPSTASYMSTPSKPGSAASGRRGRGELRPRPRVEHVVLTQTRSPLDRCQSPGALIAYSSRLGGTSWHYRGGRCRLGLGSTPAAMGASGLKEKSALEAHERRDAGVRASRCSSPVGFSRLTKAYAPAACLARSSRFLTVETCHRPPRAVRMPRSLRTVAIAAIPVTPADRIDRITGRTFAAKRSASSVCTVRPSAAASFALRGLPSLVPEPSAGRGLCACAPRSAAAPSRPAPRRGGA
jgi:hypothetical protein